MTTTTPSTSTRHQRQAGLFYFYNAFACCKKMGGKHAAQGAMLEVCGINGTPGGVAKGLL